MPEGVGQSLLTKEMNLSLYLLLEAMTECQGMVQLHKMLEFQAKNDGGKVERRELTFINIYVNCLAI